MSLTTGKFKKAYFEITNACNASCDFCPGTVRKKRFVTEAEFDNVISKLDNRVEYLYFHLMGEPLLHPSITSFALKARSKGFNVMITTNGILSKEVGIPLIKTGAVKKCSISVHSYEANSFNISLHDYLSSCFDLAEEAASVGTVCALRLWNNGTEKNLNESIIAEIKSRFSQDFCPIRTGFCVSENIFIEYGDRFDWPDASKESSEVVFCHGLRNQIGILSDGTVVPCCLDAEGRIPLGNLFTDTLDNIIRSDIAKTMYDGFSTHTAIHPLCKSCGFAKRFKK